MTGPAATSTSTVLKVQGFLGLISLLISLCGFLKDFLIECFLVRISRISRSKPLENSWVGPKLRSDHTARLCIVNSTDR